VAADAASINFTGYSFFTRNIFHKKINFCDTFDCDGGCRYTPEMAATWERRPPQDSPGIVFHGKERFVVSLVAVTTRPSRPLHGQFDKKSRNLYTPPVFDAPVGGPRRNFAKLFSVEKTRMIGLPYAEESMMVC